MDCQNGILAAYAEASPDLLKNAGAVLHAARSAELKVVYVKVAFRPGFPEIGSRNALFRKDSPMASRLREGPETEIHPHIAPQEGDVVVVKRRVSAFAGSDLELILRANDIDTLVLFGVATSGVVLSTLRQAADADYRLVVISDCCADRDPAVHSCLMEKVFPRQATLATSAEVIRAFESLPTRI